MNNQKSGILTTVLVLGIIGAVFAMAGGIACLSAVACADALAEAVSGENIPIELWIWSIGAFAAGVLAIVGAAMARKGGIVTPIILLVAGVLAILSIWIVNFLGLIGGILLVIAAILAFVGRNKTSVNDNFNNNNFNNNDFNNNFQGQ